MPSDPLSDVLTLLDAHSVVTNGLQAGGDWAFRCPVPEGLKFIAVVEGEACIYSDEVELLSLQPGDVMLLNGNRPYVLASSAAVEPVDADAIFADSPDGIGRFGEPEVVMLGGRVALDRAHGNLLLDVLPPVVHLAGASTDAAAVRWMIDRLDAEAKSDRPGSTLATAQLAHLIVVQVLRGHLERGGAAVTGWLRGLADPRIAPALSLLHQRPERNWQLRDLAQAVGMSRTAFAVRFREVTGITPLSYLSRWRMHLAERALAGGTQSVGAVARSLGYASDAAFSTAFKRVRGTSPKNFLPRRTGVAGR